MEQLYSTMNCTVNVLYLVTTNSPSQELCEINELCHHRIIDDSTVDGQSLL